MTAQVNAPTSAVTDEAVIEEAVHHAIIAAGATQLHGDRVAQIRAAVKAAAPLLGNRPLLDRDALGRVLIHFGADVRAEANEPAAMFGEVVDAVMELARPMPTQQEIAYRLDHIVFKSDHIHYRTAKFAWRRTEALRQANAVLALINGDPS